MANYTGIPQPPLSPEEQHRRALRLDGNFIGAGMLFLSALSQMLFTVVVLVFVLFGFIRQESLSKADLGLGNTDYLLVYMTVYALMMGLPMLLASAFFRRKIQPFAPARRVRPFDFIGGLLAGMAMCVVANIVANYVMIFLETFGVPEPSMPQMMVDTPLSLVLNLLTLAVLPALLEEMVFRGYILQTLRPYGDRTALLVSSLLFALMHGNVLQIPFALIVGLVLGYVVIQTNNIWLAVCIHFANNAMSVLVEYAGFRLPNAEAQNLLTVVVLCGLAILGFIALIVLKARHSPLSEPPARSAPGSGAGANLKTLCTAPLFIISLIVFCLLVMLSVLVY